MLKNAYTSVRCILLTSPDQVDHVAFRGIADQARWTLVVAHDGEEGRSILRRMRFDAVFADSQCWKTLLP